MWMYGTKRLREGIPWSDADGIQHPANWHIWSEEEKRTRGLVWVVPQPDLLSDED